MKDLSEKFDQLPRDFDREAIWHGIHRPKARKRVYPLLWGALFFIVVAVVIYFMVPIGATGEDKAGADQASVLSPPDYKITLPATVRPISGDHAETNEMGGPVLGSGENLAVFSPEKSAVSEPATLQDQGPIDQGRSEQRQSGQGQMDQHLNVQANSISIAADGEAIATSLPVIFHEKDRFLDPFTFLPPGEVPLLNTSERELAVSLSGIEPVRKKGGHALAIQTGIGTHHTFFTSADEVTGDWRSGLERSQLDYSLGLRYQYLFRNGWLVSATSGYQLFKDKINTSFVREMAGEKTKIDYRLYNHYHVFAGRIEAGKRFHRRDFFWDIAGGMGFKFYQDTETSFFLAEGELADDTRVDSDYSKAGNVFVTGHAAIGKYLAGRLFTRAGVQIYSPLRLSSSQAAVGHNILPVGMFLEIGMQF